MKNMVAMDSRRNEISIGIIGGGLFGRAHIRAYQSLPRVKIAAICDINRKQAEKVAGDFNIPFATNQVADVLSNPAIQAVSVVTPEAHHRKIVIKALEAGKHVLCEKPLALNLNDAKAMCETAKRTGRFLLPAHVMRFAPKIIRARKELEKIGPVISIHSRRNRTIDLHKIYNRTHPVLENSIHDIDIIRWFVGRSVRRVYSVTRNVLKGPHPDVVWGLLEFEGGAVGVVETIWIIPQQPIETLVDHMHIVARHGTIDLRFDDEGMKIYSEKGIQTPHLSYWNETHAGLGGALAEEIAYFVRCVDRNERPRVIEPEDGIEAVRIAQALIKSSKRRAPVELS